MRDRQTDERTRKTRTAAYYDNNRVTTNRERQRYLLVKTNHVTCLVDGLSQSVDDADVRRPGDGQGYVEVDDASGKRVGRVRV